MPTALDAVLDDVNSLKADAEDGYRAVVRRLAADEHLDSELVLGACEAAGRSMDDLRDDVNRLAARIRAADLLAALPERTEATRLADARHAAAVAEADQRLRDALAELDRQRAAAVAARQADPTVAAAGRAKELAWGEFVDSRDARDELTRTAPPHLLERLNALRAERVTAAEKLRTQEAEVRKFADLIDRTVIPARRDDAKSPYGSELDRERGRRDEAAARAKAERQLEVAEFNRGYHANLARTTRGRIAEIDAEVFAIEVDILVP
ncbi:MAG: hypothetical protein C0501_17495 [Isosphaera sp.]|nr:hypothetical protein [Isosphaera sp.]